MTIAQQNQIRQMYEQNLRLLSPWLKETVEKIGEEELWKRIEVTYNEDGCPVCRYRRDGRRFHVTGEHPVRQAQEWGKTVPGQGTGAYFVYGCGFGYALFELFAHKAPNTLVVVFEEDICLFKAMLYYFDLAPIMKTGKIVFLVGGSEYFSRALDELFFSVVFFNCTSPAVVFTYAAQRNFKAQYLEIHRYVFKQLGMLVFYIGNDHQDNLLGMKNLLANAGEILRNPYIGCLKNRYKGFPAFIVSNGPSLDKNIQKLKEIQGRGLILSVESAIVPLTKNGIIPDILTIVERTKYTYLYHFKDRAYSPEISLLCLALVDKRVFPAFSGERIPIFRSGEAINQWINRYIGDGSSIDAGANVSHLALELAVYLGADPIVFVGQDFAYGPDEATHSKDAFYAQEKGHRAQKVLRSIPAVYLEGNDGTMLKSNRLWSDFKTGLEFKIARCPEHLFLNATEGGAKIQGTVCIPLDAAIQSYCKKSLPYRVNRLVAENRKQINAEERRERLSGLKKSAGEYAAQFRALAQKTNRARLECCKMIRLSKENSEKYRGLLEETYLNNIRLFYGLLDDSLICSFCQQTMAVYFYLMNRLGKIDTPEKITEMLRIQQSFLNDLSAIGQSVSVHMENAERNLRSLSDHLEIYGGIQGDL
jgi:Uncharacterized protein conserved in bacteria